MSFFWVIIMGAGVLLLWALLDRALNPWLAKRAINKILTDIKTGKQPKPHDYKFEITFDNTHFSIRSRKEMRTAPILMRWDEIHRITAFKRDLLRVDLICLLIVCTDETGMELDEDMKGWSEFTEALPKFLPTSQPLEDWIWKVTQPPFATSQTEIYKRRITESKLISA